MSSHKSLVITSRDGTLEVLDTPTQAVTSGSALVEILAAPIVSYMPAVYTNRRPYPYPTPLVPGTSAIARVKAVGPDSTTLRPGQLVHVDCFVHGRDDAEEACLTGLVEGFTDGGRKLMRDEWRHAGTFAQIAKVPLENCVPLNEERLLGGTQVKGLGLSVEELTYLGMLLIPFGGLRDIGFAPGETIIVAPATGGFGGAGVLMALGMGAGKVIAMGRSEDGLKRIKEVVARMSSEFEGRIETVRISGDVAADSEALTKAAGGKGVDAYLDISPPVAKDSTHIKSAILALRRRGRMSLMGGITDDITIPHGVIMAHNLTLKGKWMYEREDVRALIQLVEMGNVKLAGLDLIGKFRLEEWEKAFQAAEGHDRIAQVCVFTP